MIAEDISRSETCKIKAGMAISQDLVPGGSTSGDNPWFEVHQVRWSRHAEKAVAEFVKYSKHWLEDNPEWCPSFVTETKASQGGLDGS